MEYWLKRYGISVLFIAAMFTLAGSIVLSTELGSGLCSADPNFLTCLRNWVSAAGNLATVLVAALALVVAWGQLKANAVMAALPSINQRIIGGKATTIIGRNLADHLKRLHDLLAAIVYHLDNKELSKASLREISGEIVAVWDSAFGDTTQIRAIADDVHDIDLENELSAIIQTSIDLEGEGRAIITLFQRLSTAEGIKELLSGTTDILTSVENIKYFAEVCLVKYEYMQEIDGRLVTIVQEAKATRLNLLRILGAPRSRSPYD